MTAACILLVEDDALIGPLLAETLAGLGYDVCALEATEGGAVAAAARHRPDLLIVDLMLAEGTGVGAVERITRAGPVPHVFISGQGMHTLVRSGVLLRKPFREAELVRAIGQALGTTDTLARC